METSTLAHRLQWVNEVPGLSKRVHVINLYIHYDKIILLKGDFHFFCANANVSSSTSGRIPSAIGSLSNLYQHIEWLGVDKKGKVLSTGDKFLVHSFHGHLAASICTHLNIASMDDDVDEETSIKWLKSTAISVVETSIMPINSSDPTYSTKYLFK